MDKKKLKSLGFCLDLSSKRYICSVKKNQEREERRMKETVKILRQIKERLLSKHIPFQLGRYLLFRSS